MELKSTNNSTLNISNLGEFNVEYVYHSNLNNRPSIKTSQDAYEIVKQVFDMKKIGLQEQIVVLYLNNNNTVIGSCNLSSGSLTSAIVDLRLILASALKLMATGVLVPHNHPSGKMIASEQDKQLTKKLKTALEQCDIKLLDHIIVSPFDGYLSLKDEGIF
jgi:DNA repair protein RadC